MTWKKSMFTLNHRHADTPLPFGWLARIASTIARFWSRGRRERHTRLMSAELQALDDRMLKDIGIHRCQIGSAVLTPRIATGAGDAIQSVTSCMHSWYCQATGAGASRLP
jgi:uncharacterized protein YjiS (DUF1127 family)